VSSNLNERFGSVPQIVAQGVQQYSEGEAATEQIANMKVNIPGHVPAGTAFRVTIAGTNATGTNGAMTITVAIGGTDVISVAGAETTTGDWIFQGLIIFKNPKVQKTIGILDKTVSTGDKKIDYAAGAVDCTVDTQLTAAITLASGSDACTVEMWTVEKWQIELSTS